MIALPKTMKAAVVKGSTVEIQQIPLPHVGALDILVRVRASALNRADLAVASGQKHGSVGGDGTVVGMEWAGEVVAIGAEVPAGIFSIGDPVMCSGAAGYAEFAATDYGRALPIPKGVDFSVASTLPVALQTMHQAIVSAGGFIKGQSVLIQGASSGVGLMGLQMAKALGASKVIGTSTNAKRRTLLREYGADLAAGSNDPDWPRQVVEATNGGVDLIIDMISGKTVNQSLVATRILGKIVNVGRLGGGKEMFDFDLHAMRRIEYIGVTFRTRSKEEVREIVANVSRDLGGLIADGTLRLPIDRTFSLDAVGEALDSMKSNKHFGKLVLLP